METTLKIYIVCWIVACIAALFILIKNRKSFGLCKMEYWQFLLKPWRLMTFVVATSGLIVIAPYTGDPTWDYFDAFFMSVLTYFTAPWAIGVLYNVLKGKLKPSQAFVAFCLWMFSASWSYDLYLILRDGKYPVTWSSNIFASSVLYISAGLFWSLDWIQGRGVTFAFIENNWPYCTSMRAFSKIVPYMLPFMILVSFLILYYFLYQNH